MHHHRHQCLEYRILAERRRRRRRIHHRIRAEHQHIKCITGAAPYAAKTLDRKVMTHRRIGSFESRERHAIDRYRLLRVRPRRPRQLRTRLHRRRIAAHPDPQLPVGDVVRTRHHQRHKRLPRWPAGPQVSFPAIGREIALVKGMMQLQAGGIGEPKAVACAGEGFMRRRRNGSRRRFRTAASGQREEENGQNE